MSNYFYDNFKLGILGGGQLGRMLIRSCINLNITSFVMDPDIYAPCNGFSHQFFQGLITDYNAVYKFGQEVDLLTYEIEHINIEALKKLQDEGKKIYPQPKVLEIVQDKGLQKEFYQKNNIPTAEFKLINNKSEIYEHTEFLPAVQKTRKFGYDGKGVHVIENREDIFSGFDVPSVLEKKIDFEKEISVIVARNPSGEIKVFPIVELVFNHEYNLVDYLFSPAAVSPEIEEKAQKIALEIAEKMNLVGLLAVEMFVCKNGDVLVNEVAPRPHNSGHHTIEANVTSQFEQQLRAILDLPLGNTDLKSPAVMINLLGEKRHTGPARYEGIDEIFKMEKVYLHLYGKKFTKPSRKMGHITVLGDTIEEALEKAEKVKEIIKVVSE